MSYGRLMSRSNFTSVEYDLLQSRSHLKRIFVLPNISSHGQTSSPTIYGSFNLVEEHIVGWSLGPTGHEHLSKSGGFHRPSEARWIASVLDLDCICADL